MKYKGPLERSFKAQVKPPSLVNCLQSVQFDNNGSFMSLKVLGVKSTVSQWQSTALTNSNQSVQQ